MTQFSDRVMGMDDDWPSRMIDQPPPVKAHWMLTDPDRYFTQVCAERRAEYEYRPLRSAKPSTANSPNGPTS